MGDWKNIQLLKYSELSNTTYPTISKTVFAIFMVLVPILLLNMLIAMMGNTYAHVIEQSEKEWMKQWAKIVVSLERAVNQADAHQYLQEYSIKLGPGDDPSTEQRGVMVIKSKSKTRAKQRKGAVANWKRVGKVTINELRKRGMTGEQLRRIMWGRASISTPVKIPLKDQAALLDMLTDAAPETPPPTGFGEALTAALDVMAFTHDLDLSCTNPGYLPPPSHNEVCKIECNGMPVEDPFRQLVINEEDGTNHSELVALAEAAAHAAVTEPIKEITAPDAALLAAKASMEQVAALEASDSDGLGDGPLLGKGSRVKRVKSAHQRAASAVAMSSEKQRLFTWRHGSSSSNTSMECGLSTPAAEFVLPPPYPDLPLPTPSAPPLEPTSVTSKPPSPPPKQRSTESVKSRPRPKTAKVNRVAPTTDITSRRGASASTMITAPSPESPPDPLEPWSTRNIANMNAILAWDQSDHDSL